jgi:hypothetical protein
MPVWPAGSVPGAAPGYAGRGPLLCGLVAHNGGSGLRPRDTPGRSGRARRWRLHWCGRWPATRSEGRRLQRRTGVAASSPGRGAEAWRLDGQRCGAQAARLGSDSWHCGDLQRRRRAVSGGRLSVKIRWRSGLPGQWQGRRWPHGHCTEEGDDGSRVVHRATAACGERGRSVRRRRWHRRRSATVQRWLTEGGGGALGQPGRESAFKYPRRCASGQRHPRQPTRVWCGATMPLTGGPHTSAVFPILITLKSITRAKK